MSVAFALLVAACGGNDVKPDVAQQIAAVKRCLTDAGVDVQGGTHDREAAGDENAPDGELVTTDATFIAFYASEARADQLAAELRTRAEGLGGTTTRHGTITVLYTKAPGTGTGGEPDARIEGCVSGSAG